ncbi:divalent-cation tolerance protein CutA [Vibrio paucivorans]
MSSDCVYSMVLTTTNSVESAADITAYVLENKLAACIQQLEIKSSYIWNGEVCCDAEFLLVIKTQHFLYQQLESALLSRHPYEVPQIVEVPFIDGFNPYLSWIQSNTSQ